MQITFHNLLPVREFIGPIILHHPPPSSPIFPRSSPSQLHFKFDAIFAYVLVYFIVSVSFPFLIIQEWIISGMVENVFLAFRCIVREI